MAEANRKASIRTSTKSKVYVNIFKLDAGWSEQLCALITPESF